MVHSCCAYGCAYRFKKGDNIGFYRFPRNNSRLKLWLNAIRRKNWTPTKSSKICGKHFQSGKPNADIDHPDYVPNVFIFRKPKGSLKVYARWQVVKDKLASFQAAEKESSARRIAAESLLLLMCEKPPQEQNESVEFSEQEESEESSLIKKLYTEINSLRVEKRKLQEQVNASNIYYSIINDPKKLSFYTGLPSVALFEIILESMKECVTHNIKLPMEVQLLIVLMKLKLNLLSSDLAFRFKTSRSTVKRIFDEWLPALAGKLESLIRWPSPKALKKHLPVSFKNSLYKNTVCIVDCTEVPIQRPSSQITRSQTWSNYKNEQTVKFLVACSPSGQICFVSDAWGGRASDREITTNCGIIDHIQPKDVVLADRGFTLDDLFASRGAKLIVPSFTRGRKQLSKNEVLYSKKISNVRIHVERAIKQIKRFRVLQTKIPITFLKYINNAIVICAGLSNLCNPIVK